MCKAVVMLFFFFPLKILQSIVKNYTPEGWMEQRRFLQNWSTWKQESLCGRTVTVNGDWGHFELALLVRRNQRAWLQSQGSSSSNCGLNAIWLGFEPSVPLILFSNDKTLTGDQTLSLFSAPVNKGTQFTAKRSYHQPHHQGPFGANCLWECGVPSRSLSFHVQLFVWFSLNDCGVFPLGFFPSPASLCHLIQHTIRAARSLEFHKRWSDAKLRHMSESRTRVSVCVCNVSAYFNLHKNEGSLGVTLFINTNRFHCCVHAGIQGFHGYTSSCPCLWWVWLIMCIPTRGWILNVAPIALECPSRSTGSVWQRQIECWI